MAKQTAKDIQFRSSSPLNADQRRRLIDIQVYLLNMADPMIASRAALYGYDAEEHQKGWAWFATAIGLNRPFEHALSQAAKLLAVNGSAALKALWRELDALENIWLPVTRDIIIAEIDDPSARETVLTAFFDGLQQQPEGPLVVGSMDLYLTRLDALANSGKPGIDRILAALAKSGLTPEERKRIRELVTRAKREAEPLPKPEVDPAEIEEASRRQLEAYDKLNRWYIRFGSLLRRVLPYNDALRLGLIAQKGGPSAAGNAGGRAGSPADGAEGQPEGQQ